MKINFIDAEPEEDRETDGKVLEVGEHTFERRDPHGFFWCVEPVSKALAGAFTTSEEAKKAVHRHNQIIEAAVNAAEALEAEKVEQARIEAATQAEIARRRAVKKEAEKVA